MKIKRIISILLIIAIVFTATATVAVAIKPRPNGDINCDYTLNLADIVSLRTVIMNNGRAPKNTLEYCDLDDNGTINLSDIVALRNLIMAGGVTYIPQSVQPEDGKVYAIENVLTAFVAQISNTRMRSTGNIVQWLYTGSTGERWKAVLADDGVHYAFMSNHNDGVLALYNTNLLIDAYGGGEISDNQLFKLTELYNGYYVISPKTDDTLALDVKGENLGDNIEFTQYVEGTKSQEWVFTQVNEIDVTDFSAMSEEVFENFMDTFYMSDGNGGAVLQNYNYFWDFAEMMEVVMDAYDRTEDVKYLNYFDSLYKGFVNRFGSNWLWNDYNDDIMWMVIACSRAYKASGNSEYKDRALFHFNAVIMRSYSTATFGGGITWMASKNSKNACINSPAVIAACYLDSFTSDPSYLQYAKDIFEWEINTLWNDSTGQIYDNIHFNSTYQPELDTRAFSYNQGTFIGAATMLFEKTGEVKYLQYAKKAADYAKTTMYRDDVMNNENDGEDGPGFKGIFVRWLCYYIKSQDISDYNEWLKLNFMTGYGNKNSRGVTTTTFARKAAEALEKPFTYSSFVALSQCLPDAQDIYVPTQENEMKVNATALMSAIDVIFWKDHSTMKLKENMNETATAFAWPYGAYIEAVCAQFESDTENAAYRLMYKKAVDGMENYKRTSGNLLRYTASYGGSGDVYYDDNMWFVMAFYKAYELLGDEEYLDKAEELAAYCYTGWDDVLGGGIYWKELGTDARLSKNTCSNAPMALASAELYRITGKPEYLDWAKRLYNWTKENLEDPEDFLYWDNISAVNGALADAKYAYNTGCMVSTAVLLYEITGEEGYLTDAKNSSASANTRFVTERNGTLRISHGDPWINSWMLEGYIRLSAHDEAASEYIERMATVVSGGYAARDVSTDLVPSNWRARGNIAAMRDQTGTARVMFNIADWQTANAEE